MPAQIVAIPLAVVKALATSLGVGPSEGIFCWQLRIGVEVTLVCPISPFPRITEDVVVEEAVMEGKDGDNSGGVMPAELLSELCMEEDKVYPTVFEVGMRGKNDVWLYALAPLACVRLYDCVKLLDGAIVTEMEVEPAVDKLCDGWPT